MMFTSAVVVFAEYFDIYD